MTESAPWLNKEDKKKLQKERNVLSAQNELSKYLE